MLGPVGEYVYLQGVIKAKRAYLCSSGACTVACPDICPSAPHSLDSKRNESIDNAEHMIVHDILFCRSPSDYSGGDKSSRQPKQLLGNRGQSVGRPRQQQEAGERRVP